ncbi:enoyl-CoA hydratase/isomerase family protein [Hyphomonas sp. WL0036]|uniref:enoyl-CoA hydratase/isomerase family protein n=1 Tax=Hyphomonas sediminis TaxID=2866160 RepID=UPI001C8000A7|nr:enoyl-CoA hydratase/isomerase family protein [Hyphomonas sediminis]MBY9068363.1 enoyl-CoA hydratase/isomerase family protein [Hyphomonas sediminis]
MSEEVLIRSVGGIGRITLTRPSALHALNTPMCAGILAALTAWKNDPAIHLVWIDHQEGTRGFCAGGDIRMLAESGAGDASEAREFFRTEYRMNAALKAFPKSVLAILDGVTMGGGVGLSVHGSHRVATERTLFAMPETGIGLFPDVGGGWFLPRLQGEVGTWLALTGARLKGADVAACGVATHYLPSEELPALAARLEAADFSADAQARLDAILAAVSRKVPPPGFAAHLETLNRCFGKETAEEIVRCLEADSSDWAKGEAVTLRSKSPETVKVSLRQLREGSKLESFEDNMRMEFRIGWRKVQSRDFQEGVRAVIIDKDNAPVWSPARIEDVSDEDVARYFAPLGADELTFPE